jgi:hypothetical protein
MNQNSRYYRIADITIKVESDLPINNHTFNEELELFRVDGPGEDTVTIHHHFELPQLQSFDLGTEVYRKTPWAIYQTLNGWLYLGILPDSFDEKLWTVAIFNQDHSSGNIYHNGSETFLNGNLHSLTMFPTDQILVARLLADRQGCYLHSAGAILNGAGMLFVGHSDAGKSTISQMLIDVDAVEAASQPPLKVEILCDDRNIVLHSGKGWCVYGSWSHGDIPNVSPASAPLRSVCFLEQADENTLIPMADRKEILRRLLACVITPFVTADWWHKTIDLLAIMPGEVPCYLMRFDKSGEIVKAFSKLNLGEK